MANSIAPHYHLPIMKQYNLFLFHNHWLCNYSSSTTKTHKNILIQSTLFPNRQIMQKFYTPHSNIKHRLALIDIFKQQIKTSLIWFKIIFVLILLDTNLKHIAKDIKMPTYTYQIFYQCSKKIKSIVDF